jgi:hypothetical protein
MPKKRKMKKIEKIELNDFSLLDSMERIHCVIAKSELSSENINEKVADVKTELTNVMEYLSLSTIESLLFCIIYNVCIEDVFVTYKSLANYLRSRTTLVYRFGSEFGRLISKGLIRREYKYNRYGKLAEHFEITDFAKKLVVENRKYDEMKLNFDFKKNSIDRMVEEITQTVEFQIFDFDPINRTFDCIDLVLKNNREIRCANRLLTLQFREKIDKILLIYFCAQYIKGYDEIQVSRFLDRVTPDEIFKKSTIQRYKEQKSELFTKDWIRFSQSLNREDFSLSLSDKAYNVLLKKDFPIIEKQLMDCSQLTVIQPESIQEKSLYYNSKEMEEVAILRQMLDADRFISILDNLHENGLPPGFNILFYGAPGTGKTETVLQLAKQTGRVIFKVNISEIRSMWVGESEKNLQKVFNIYRHNAGITERFPILLLNEADAIIGKRINVVRSVDQMNNSMQNILLQELEQFVGILIATTNLKQNLDHAFDRRFLYKVNFGQPDANVRRKIIDTMLPEIPDHVRLIIAESYSLSGAQLENIKKKFHVYQLIRMEPPSEAEIENWCMEETGTSTSTSVGFKFK